MIPSQFNAEAQNIPWLEAKQLAGIPESVVLYCARHRFATDALQATGNIFAVMDAMGHERVDTLRIYSHPELTRSVTR
jgi:site-specific recombinase XerC